MSSDILNYLSYSFLSSNEESHINSPVSKGRTMLFPYPCNQTDHCFPYNVTIKPGYYRFELWGAQGGDGHYTNSNKIHPDSGGKGAYVSGNIKIVNETIFYLYIGGKGGDNWQVTNASHGIGGFNGGQDGGADLADRGAETGTEYSSNIPESSAGGGGATDIRLIYGNTKESLVSRIIIAAGGGGAASTNSSYDFANFRGGHGGNLTSSVFNVFTEGASQEGAIFGKGSSPLSVDSIIEYNISGGSIGGGGGGYFGGSRLDLEECLEKEPNNICVGGPGGSSYISGYKGCNSVTYNETNQSIEHTGYSHHPSNYVFYNSIMRSGLEEKHSDSGKIEITFLRPLVITQKPSSLHLKILFSSIFIFIKK